MVQVVKSTKDFELFGGATLARLAEVRQGERSAERSRRGLRKFRSRSDFSQMRRSRARNCRI